MRHKVESLTQWKSSVEKEVDTMKKDLEHAKLKASMLLKKVEKRDLDINKMKKIVEKT